MSLIVTNARDVGISSPFPTGMLHDLIFERSLWRVEREIVTGWSVPGGAQDATQTRLHPVVVPCQRSQTTQAKTPFNASAALRCMVSVTCE